MLVTCSWWVRVGDRKCSVRVVVALVVADKAWFVGMASLHCDMVEESACVALVEHDVLEKRRP